MAISVFFKAYILHLSLLAYLCQWYSTTLVGLYALLRRKPRRDVHDMVREENGQSDLAVESFIIVIGIDFFGQREFWQACSAFCICSSWLLQNATVYAGSLTMDKISSLPK